MDFKDISLPEAYKESADFRLFIDWISLCFSKVKYDTENIVDLLDPERCPKSLLWLLADTFGFRYDDRLLPAFNRLVLLYFMSMIRNRGSRTGITIAAEVNLAQFNLNSYAEEDKIYEDRLKDTTIPVNSVYVTEHTDEGWVDIVYYSENAPIDACLEYVRPLGMYCFARPGVDINARTKISVDARLTDTSNVGLTIGPTRVGHYRRADYASMQGVTETLPHSLKLRNKSFYRNSDFEKVPSIDAGYRSLNSLQLCNNEHIIRALMPSGEEYDPIFYLGLTPEDVKVSEPANYYKDKSRKLYNLLYDYTQEKTYGDEVYTIDEDRSPDEDNPRPAVNKPMMTLGQALSTTNSQKSLTKFTQEELEAYKHAQLTYDTSITEED